MKQMQLSNEAAPGALPSEAPRRAVGGYMCKVINSRKLEEIEAVLFNPSPSHYDRIWMTGYLLYVKYTLEEICSIIDELNEWNNYSPRITYNQVRSIEHINMRKK